MCLGESCPRKSKCLRASGNLNPRWQSYANFEGICLENDNFTYFLEDFREEMKR